MKYKGHLWCQEFPTFAGNSTFKNIYLIQAFIYQDHCKTLSKEHEITAIHNNLMLYGLILLKFYDP